MTELELLQERIEGFMNKHDLRGIEVIKAHDGEYIYRACGRGMIHTEPPFEGTPIWKQFHLWEGLNDMLPAGEKVIE